MADRTYTKGRAVAVKSWDDAAVAFGILLLGAGYVFNAGHEALTELAGEPVDPSYARIILTGRTKVDDEAANVTRLRCDNPLWPGLSAGTIEAAVIYRDGASDAARMPVGFINSVFPFVTNGSDVELTWHADGTLVIAEGNVA